MLPTYHLISTLIYKAQNFSRDVEYHDQLLVQYPHTAHSVALSSLAQNNFSFNSCHLALAALRCPPLSCLTCIELVLTSESESDERPS